MTTRPHPADAEYWEWDEGNESELWNHHIEADEVVQVWENRPVWVPNIRHRAGDWKMIGATHGGRRITVVVRYNDENRTLRPITAWRCTDGEISRYF
jgi:uncharacterized DUF497 family protein